MIEVVHTYSGLSALWAGVIFGAAATVTGLLVGVLASVWLTWQGNTAAERAAESPVVIDAFGRRIVRPGSRRVP